MVDLSDPDPKEWVETDHERIVYRSESDKWNRGELELAELIAEHIPDWTICLTMGPYRGYDFSYDIYPEHELIHIDCYSAAMAVYGPQIPHRKEHPVVEHAEPVLKDIMKDIKKVRPEFTFSG